jgi:hypothetical protein
MHVGGLLGRGRVWRKRVSRVVVGMVVEMWMMRAVMMVMGWGRAKRLAVPKMAWLERLIGHGSLLLEACVAVRVRMCRWCRIPRCTRNRGTMAGAGKVVFLHASWRVGVEMVWRGRRRAVGRWH